MTKVEAYTLLSFHSGRNDDIDNPKWTNGFLGSLRPFRGELNENNFIEIMDCLQTIADDFITESISQPLIYDIYNIIHLGRRWAEDDSPLMSNRIMTDEQQKTLIRWVDIIQDCLFYLLNGDEESAFDEFRTYQTET